MIPVWSEAINKACELHVVNIKINKKPLNIPRLCYAGREFIELFAKFISVYIVFVSI